MVPPITAATEARRLIIFIPARDKSSTAQILSGASIKASKHQSIAKPLSSRVYLLRFSPRPINLIMGRTSCRGLLPQHYFRRRRYASVDRCLTHALARKVAAERDQGHSGSNRSHGYLSNRRGRCPPRCCPNDTSPGIVPVETA